MLYLQYMLLIKLGCSNVKSIINVPFRYYRFIEHNWTEIRLNCQMSKPWLGSGQV